MSALHRFAVVAFFLFFAGVIHTDCASAFTDEDTIGAKAATQSVDEPNARIYVLVSDKLPEGARTNTEGFSPIDFIRSRIVDGLAGLKVIDINSADEAKPDQAGYFLTLAAAKVNKFTIGRSGWNIHGTRIVMNFQLSKSVEGKWKKAGAGQLAISSRSHPAPALTAAVYGSSILGLKVKSCKAKSGGKAAFLLVGSIKNESTLAAKDIYVNCLSGPGNPFVPFDKYAVPDIAIINPGETVSFAVEVDGRFEQSETKAGPQNRDWMTAYVACATWVKPEEKATPADDAKKTPKTEEMKKEEVKKEVDKKEEVKKEEKEEVTKKEAKSEW